MATRAARIADRGKAVARDLQQLVRRGVGVVPRRVVIRAVVPVVGVVRRVVIVPVVGIVRRVGVVRVVAVVRRVVPAAVVARGVVVAQRVVARRIGVVPRAVRRVVVARRVGIARRIDSIASAVRLRIVRRVGRIVGSHGGRVHGERQSHSERNHDLHVPPLPFVQQGPTDRGRYNSSAAFFQLGEYRS